MAEQVSVTVRDEEPVDPMIGRVLNGRFTLLERIGAGGMGRVYRALQAPLDRVVAVKILDSNYSAGRDPLFQKRFFLEASHTSKLRHPNTITVIDYGKTDDGIFFIAMEYVEGCTLAQLITSEGALPESRVLHITQQICRSLREAHKVGIIHRDLKPANVMLLQEETDHDLVKVLDFGLVKSVLPPETEDAAPITQSGTLLGSPLYMAPEHARHLPMDARSDIYSLGVMMYQMLVGKPPFQGQSIDVIVKHVHDLPKPPRIARPDLEISPEAESIVLKCIEKDPNNRFQSMDELLQALRAAGVAAPATGPRARPLHDPERDIAIFEKDDEEDLTRVASESDESAAWRKSHWPWVLAGVIALVVSSAAMFLYLQWGYLATPDAPILPKTVDAPPAVIGSTRFVIHSNPTRAKVSIDGKVVGATPLEVEVSHDDKGRAQAALLLEHEGFEPRILNVEGREPEVVVTAVLNPLAPAAPSEPPTVAPEEPTPTEAAAAPEAPGVPAPKPPSEPRGYKADPYE